MAGNELSFEEFSGGGATAKPAAKLEMSFDEFSSGAEAAAEETTSSNKAFQGARMVPSGTSGLPRVQYDRGANLEELKTAGKIVGETALTMASGWAAMVPAGWEGLAKTVYQKAGGNISPDEITGAVEGSLERLTYAPRSKEAQIVGEAMGEGMEKGFGWVGDKVYKEMYFLAKSRGKSNQEADRFADAAATGAKVELEALLNIVPVAPTIRGMARVGAAAKGAIGERAARQPRVEPSMEPDYGFQPEKRQGPVQESAPIFVDEAGTAMSAEALAAREALRARMPEASRIQPQGYKPVKIKGPTLSEHLDEVFKVTSDADRAALHARRGREIREAFKNDKDYADYSQWVAENTDGMREILRTQVKDEVAKGKVRLPEGVDLGPAEPRPSMNPIVGQLDSYQSGLQKIQQNRRFDLTAEELAAVRDLSSSHNRPKIAQAKIEAGRIVDVTPNDLNAMRQGAGRSIWTPETGGPINPATLKKLGLTAGVVAVVAPFATEQQLQDMSLLGAALMIKPKGGMWHPEAAGRLAKPIQKRAVALEMADAGDAQALAAHKEANGHIERMTRNYLNKHAATEGDPLREVQIPFGDHTEGFGRVLETLTGSETAATMRRFQTSIKPVANEQLLAAISKAAPDENIYNFQRSMALESYLEHVGDYLRQNVKPEDLSKYDLVRAVKETAKWDADMAKKMKDAAKSGEGTAVHKEYPDGMKWVEVGVRPEKLPEGYRVEFYEPDDAWRLMKGKDEIGLIVDEDAGYVPKTKVEAEAEATRLIAAEALNAEGNIMGHCVGGYCDQVLAGEAKIYSLRDKNGESHVTVEVTPPTKPGENVALHNIGQQSFSDLSSIMQIKGKQNRAPVAKYLPYVQDFVKSGKWGEVSDLANAKLYDVTTMERGQAGRAKAMFPEQRFISEKDWTDSIVKEAREIHEARSIDPALKERVDATPVVDGILEIGAKEINDPVIVRTESGREMKGVIVNKTPGENAINPFRFDVKLDNGEVVTGVRFDNVQPTPELIRARRLRDQQGFADPALLKAIAATGVGAAAGAYLAPQNPVSGAIIGALGLNFARRVPWSSLVKGLDYSAGIASTRVRNISPMLALRWRNFEMGVLKGSYDRLAIADPFLVALNKLPKELQARFERAALSENGGAIEGMLGEINNPKFRKAYADVRKVYDELGQKMKDMGIIKDTREVYFRRIVKDREGLLKALDQELRTKMEQRLKEAEITALKNRGTGLTVIEESNIINNSLIEYRAHGYQPGFAKSRRIAEITEELQPFYGSLTESTHAYIRGAVEEIEKAKFFGKNAAYIEKSGQKYLNIDASVGNIIRGLVEEGKLTYKQASEVADILQSRFGPGERASSAIVQDLKNLGYAGLLGNPISAAVQLGDIAISAFTQGLRPTFVGVVKTLTGRPYIRLRDLGLVNHISEEFTSIRKTAKFLNTTLKYGGFSGVDTFGKSITINAAIHKLSGWAQTERGRAKIAAKYGEALGDDLPAFIDDLKARKLTDNTRLLAFSELSDMQPISKAEVTQLYLDNPSIIGKGKYSVADARMLYMLKSFTLKQIDLARNSAYNEIKKGNVAKGTYDLARYSILLGTAGVGVEVIKSWMRGENVDVGLADAAENVLKTFGWSTYALNKAAQGKPIEATINVATPPYKMMDDIIRMDPKAVQYIPVVGKLYYYRVGEGSDEGKRKKKERQRFDRMTDVNRFEKRIRQLEERAK